MNMILGNKEIKSIYVGSTAAAQMYLGNAKVWPEEEPQPVADFLCFTAQEANSTVRLDKVGSPGVISLETSTNGSTWTDYSWTDSTGDTLTIANVGDKVYMRAKTENQTIGSSGSNYYKFIMTGQIAASGNIQTLLKVDGSRTDVPSNCYRYIFENCSSLTTAPSLPATSIASYCYYNMFFGCSSLTTAPALPATTLASYCYNEMFSGCTSLTTAPTLPAAVLKSGCYYYMFNGCTKLASIDVSFTAWNPATATNNWLNNVAASGTFTCPTALGTDSTITRGASKCPNGWTVVNPTNG